MKLFIIMFLAFLPASEANYNLRENVRVHLYNVLDFIDRKYNEINFDGLLGITFAHAILENSLNLPFSKSDRESIFELIEKCEKIHRKIYPLLPDDPKYMITFRRKLLDSHKWTNVIPKNFTLGQIKHLGYYKNWTANVIRSNKKAYYKGVKSDACLREILELSQSGPYCYVSKFCWDMMLNPKRVDTGYLLTHRLLYLQIVKLQNCKLPDDTLPAREYIKAFCSYIYKETITSENLGYPSHDIFLEQVVLCGMEGFSEFMKEKWLKNIISWQTPYGCYRSAEYNITKRTSVNIDFGCSDHTTGLAAAALSIFLRYTLWTDVYYYF